MITFGGLASGLDTNALIEGLKKAEEIPINLLKSKKSEIGAAKDLITGFTSKMSALKTAALALKSYSGFSSYTAASSSTSVGASVSGTPTKGSYSLSVGALAKAETTASNTVATDTTALGNTGTLSYAVGTNSYTVTVAAGDSLSTIASNITAGGAVSASVLQVASGQYKLIVTGSTGATNAISFTETGTIGSSLQMTQAANETVAAASAQLTINGTTISRDSNTVSDGITGITLTLNALITSSAAATVTVAGDAAALQTKIGSFVTAYNDVVAAGQSAAGYGGTKAANKQLAGDFSIRSALSTLGGIMSSQVAGTTGKYTTLSSAGLSTTSTGKISLNATKLTEALTADPNAVAKLFVVATNDPILGSPTGAMGDFDTKLSTLLSTPSGLLTNKSTSLGNLMTKMDKDIENMEMRLSAYEGQLRKTFSNLEILVAQFNNQASALSSLAPFKYS